MRSRIARLALSLLLRGCARARRDARGQALVESAIIMPLMTFLILGIIQLVMMQHARVMTEYAAFNAARAGIVWNADKIIMENAAIISLLPTYEGLFKQSDLGNPLQMLKRIAQRALLYQKSRRLPQAVDLLKNGTGKIINNLPLINDKNKKALNKQKNKLLNTAEKMADKALQKGITKALGPGDDRFVSVKIINPKSSDFGRRGREIEFDDPKTRDQTRLSIQVQYLYMMRVPFANMIIHQAWLAGAAGKELYGAIWNPQMQKKETGFRSVAPLKLGKGGYGSSIVGKMAKLSKQGVYMVPIKTTYTMRMQSNPYKQSLEVK